MGRKPYIKDDRGRYLKVLPAHFRITLTELNRVQLSKEIQEPSNEHWCHIYSVLSNE